MWVVVFFHYLDIRVCESYKWLADIKIISLYNISSCDTARRCIQENFDIF